MKLGLVITTCKHYFSNIPKLLYELEICKYPKENIIVVSGQEDENMSYYDNGIKIVKVTYTGLHLTGLIHMYENMKDYNNIDYWLALPDTLKIGPSFYDNIIKFCNMNIVNNEIYCIPLISPKLRPTMDMGILNIKHINNMGDYLTKIKKILPYNMNDLIHLKRQLIFDENLILGLSAVNNYMKTKFEYVDPLYPKPNLFLIDDNNKIVERKVMINNKICNEVNFILYDLCKYQRNFNGPNVKLIMEL